MPSDILQMLPAQQQFLLVTLSFPLLEVCETSASSDSDMINQSCGFGTNLGRHLLIFDPLLWEECLVWLWAVCSNIGLHHFQHRGMWSPFKKGWQMHFLPARESACIPIILSDSTTDSRMVRDKLSCLCWWLRKLWFQTGSVGDLSSTRKSLPHSWWHQFPWC